MESRIKRAARAWSGELIVRFENPETVLRQNLRELQALVPRMNATLALIQEEIILLEKELQKSRLVEQDLCNKIKQVIRMQRDDLAAQYCLRLERIREEITLVYSELEFTRTAHQRALDVKNAFLQAINRKTREATKAIREQKVSESLAGLADAVQQFDVNGLDATQRAMVDRLCHDNALNEAKLEQALGSIDVDGHRLDFEFEQIKIQDILREFKDELQTATEGPTQSDLPDSEPPVQPAVEH
jgi:phage shock protein A